MWQNLIFTFFVVEWKCTENEGLENRGSENEKENIKWQILEIARLLLS